jgi:hypothetical protein
LNPGVGTELAIPEARVAAPRRPLSISYPFLIGVYVAIPACLALQAIDALLLGGRMRIALPDPATSGFLGFAAMGIPHIIGSSVVMASNGEYLKAYRARLGWTMLWIAAFFAGALVAPYWVAFTVLGILTVAHLFHQQMGIGKGICRAPPRAYATWVWTSIAYGSLLYNHMYLGETMSPSAKAAVDWVLVAFGVVVLAQVIWLHRHVQTPKGRAYLWANCAMVLASPYFYFTGWYFFAALAPRLIHDTTAFAFYVVHDHNRNREAPTNALHRAARVLGLGTWWVTPLVATGLTVLVMGMRGLGLPSVGAADQSLVVYFLVFLTLVHYSTEAVTWKRGSPYRAFVPVTV